MYQDIKKILGASDKKHVLHIQSRYSDKAPTYQEYIYVWKK
jgi:hypothetical protein